MTSKRNSRVYLDEMSQANEAQSKPTKTKTPLRSRRSSRNAPKEEIMQIAKDLEESQHNAVSILEASTIARSQSTASVTSNGGSIARTYESTPMSVSTSTSSMSSRTSEHPPAPVDGRPLNFGIVIPGVYRSSYPKSSDFEYIASLGLKTVVTLVKKEERDTELETFLDKQGIRQVIFNMKGTKKEAIPLQTMESILNIVLDKARYPLMLHCNHGKHRTGCVVGVIRKISGWNTSNVLDEYKAFAEPKARECDLNYISTFQVSSLHSLQPARGDQVSRSAMESPAFYRSLLVSLFVLTLWAISGAQMGNVLRQDRLSM
ncbi:tyrosine phosphatase family-domain-containing protein [Thelonectria olida]|uniref:Tyrosine phosphatase family-domain-containing protein n=1 Tax=Thelonectria olida TaxID=1576542 RepID=A0A9P8W525_9HYPO|nr:tyrosine phosphatase family-domain-containing protein [Thelonectria olida]